MNTPTYEPWECWNCGKIVTFSPHSCHGPKFGDGCGASRFAIGALPPAERERVMREYHRAFGGVDEP